MFLRLADNIAPGSYVVLTVEDTGAGMTPAILARAFDPYFTTKPNHRSSGLGLSVVRSIVDAYNGHIRLYSEPGAGTCANIYIPALDTHASHFSPPDNSDPAPIVKGNNEHILLIDDQPVILDVIGGLLKALNYRPTPCDTGAAALDAFCEQPDKFAAVISDVTMPKMTGPELVQKIKAVNPKVKTILISGLGSGARVHSTISASDIDAYITKPATMDDLARVLTRVLTTDKEK